MGDSFDDVASSYENLTPGPSPKERGADPAKIISALSVRY